MDVLDKQIMREPSNIQKEAAKTERQLAAMYAQISSAHRLRAIGMETGDEKHFSLSEQYFDNAEQIGREAFDVVSFNVARYTIDGKPYQEALLKLLAQAQHAPLYPDDVRRVIKIADDAHAESDELF